MILESKIDKINEEISYIKSESSSNSGLMNRLEQFQKMKFSSFEIKTNNKE